MRLRFWCAAAVLLAGVPCFATPVSITPGTTVTPGMGTFGGMLVDSVSGMNNAGNVLYTDSVFADPDNPLCAGCFDFVITVTNLSLRKDALSVVTANFNGDKYALKVGYEDLGANEIFLPPFAATESANGKRIKFDFGLGFLQSTDPLIIYTNAVNDTDGTLSIKLGRAVTDPPAFAPAGRAVAVTPEPSSLLLLGTGVVGALGIARRRFVQP